MLNLAKKVGKDRTNDYKRYDGIDKDYDFEKNHINPGNDLDRSSSSGNSNR